MRGLDERFAAMAEKSQGNSDERPADQEQEEANAKGEEEGTHDDGAQRPIIFGTIGLRHKAGRAHPQKAETPEQEIEDHCAQGDAAKKFGTGHVTGQNRIDQR
jgi:hypothetical protein